MERGFQFFDTVISKKTGFPAKGIVYGIVHPWLFETMIIRHVPKRWDELYPEWRKNPVYYVVFEKPQKACTKEELRLGQPDATEEQINLWFDEQPQSRVACYPMDDLEMFEEGILTQKLNEEESGGEKSV